MVLCTMASTPTTRAASGSARRSATMLTCPLDVRAGSVGDVNNDGFADFMIGASRYDANDVTDAGGAFLIFGSATINLVDTSELQCALARPSRINRLRRLSSLLTGDGSLGKVYNGVASNDQTGYSVAGAGDVSAPFYTPLQLVGQQRRLRRYSHRKQQRRQDVPSVRESVDQRRRHIRAVVAGDRSRLGWTSLLRRPRQRLQRQFCW